MSAHALFYADRPRGLKKLPARGRGARLSVSPPDDENDVMRTAEVYFGLKTPRKRKTANGLKEDADSLSDSRGRL